MKVLHASESALADYWAVYETHRDELEAELMPVVAEIPELAAYVAGVDPELQDKRRIQSFELQRAAVLSGDWTPYLQDLRMQGREYSALGIRFVSWNRLLGPWRRALVPRLVQRFTDDPPRLRAALQATHEVTDAAMTAIAEGYITAERSANERARSELEVALAELEHRNVELQEFAYVASHDLQEPLRQVSAFAQLLERESSDQLTDDGRRALDYVVEGATRMREQIAALLSYSRTDRAEVKLESFAVGQLVDEVVGDLQDALAEAGGEVEHGPLPQLEADRRLVQRVFQNLLGNAIKYRADERALRIHISAERGPKAWVFSVSDNGPGVAPEHRQRIFRIFQRLTPRDRTGSGIGLAISKKAVERHGGRIWVEAAPGDGAVFKFEIPDPAR